MVLRDRLRVRLERVVLFFRVHRDAYVLFFALEHAERDLGGILRQMERETGKVPAPLSDLRVRMSRPLRHIISPD